MSAGQTSIAVALRAAIELQPGEQLYAIIDAAQDPGFARCIREEFKLPARMLFRGQAAEYLDDVAPWLFSVSLDHPAIERWAGSWGKNLGIFLVSKASLGSLLRHLRNVFVVKDDTGQEFFLRFYDPRVLPTFLNSCSPQELTDFFGPIRRIFSESTTGPSITRFLSSQAGESTDTRRTR